MKEALRARSLERSALERAARPPKPPKAPPTLEELARRKEKDAQRTKAYRDRHPGRVKESGKRWREANLEKVRERSRKNKAKKIAENQRRVNAIKGDHCPKCGRKKPQKFLHFHHRDPSTKYKSVSQMLGMAWPRIEAEIAKCDVLCIDCHTALHKEEALAAAGQLQLEEAVS